MGNYDAEIRVSTKVETSQMQKLQIQIDKACNKVETLTKEYDELKNKKIPTQGYKDLQERLSAAKKEMEKLKAQDSKLSALDEKIQKLSQSSAEYAAKMKEIAEQKIPTQEYSALDKEIRKLEERMRRVAENRQKILAGGGKENAPSYRKMTYELESLETQIDSTYEKIKSMEESGKAFTLGADTDQYKNLSAKYESVNAELEKQKGIHSEIAQKQAESVQKVIELKAQMNQLVEEGKAFTIGSQEEINSKFNELEMAKAELRMLITKQDELGGKSVKVSDGLKKIGSAAKKAFGEISKGSSKARSGISLLRNSANKAFLSVSRGAKNSTNMLSAFTKRLKGLAASAFIFNLFSKGFNFMVSSMKTGFTNLMEYSSSFANSIQSVKNSLSTLGNQFAAAFAPIVQMVIPWLTSFINVISKAMTYVAQFIAILGGKSTFTCAKQIQDSYNKSLAGTASAAKKAAGALAKFDDLDVLQKKRMMPQVGQVKWQEICLRKFRLIINCWILQKSLRTFF